MPEYPYQPGCKTGGTSAEAADSMRSTAATLRQQVLDLLRDPHNIMTGLTADEAAAKLHESVLSIRPRFTELMQLKLIKDSGRRRKNQSGRSAAVWISALSGEQMRLL